jgi:hypothetical protein
MQDLLASTEACLAASPDDPAAMLEAFVAHHVAYHLERKREVYIANFELRALDQKNYEIITRDRRSYESKLITILQAGNDAGAFSVTDAKITAFAILAMLTGTCTWYKPDGRLSKLTVAKFYVDLVMNGFLARAEPR